MEQTPEQQAKTLVEAMANALYDANGTGSGAIHCAVIAANTVVDSILVTNHGTFTMRAYWEEVKTILSKMQ